jgi:hypothetical protein
LGIMLSSLSMLSIVTPITEPPILSSS